MDNNKQLLRKLPKMDELLNNTVLIEMSEKYGAKSVLDTARDVIDELRNQIISQEIKEINSDDIINSIVNNLQNDTMSSLKKVINATGIILHTNLGRAVIGEKVANAVMDIACGYSTLEYSCETGGRGSRHDHAQKLLTKLCGTEDAMVVNNNAAAVMLALGAIAQNKEVIVSRGELVEIGGAFRVPEIMELSGNILKEIGTTNKTHPEDYSNAINDNTGALLKVHTSNFKIIGFTEEVGLDTLAEIGHSNNLPVIYDLGGGALLPLEQFGIIGEPNVPTILKSGIDILTFSGDKLLGGPQAGIIVGKKKYIDLMKKHPLARAVRVDKFTLAMLCETLKCYIDTDVAIRDIPTINMIAVKKDELTRKGKVLLSQLNNEIKCELVDDFGQVGGGSVPTQMIDSVVCQINDQRLSPTSLEQALRKNIPPIISRISKDRVLLDMRTISEKEIPIVANALNNCFNV
ncbi:MAG: L-seryl-tRNA(Sec) selenium transferase [Oscillospiraceae bacterium]